jgi:hypothetical protein
LKLENLQLGYLIILLSIVLTVTESLLSSSEESITVETVVGVSVLNAVIKTPRLRLLGILTQLRFAKTASKSLRPNEMNLIYT